MPLGFREFQELVLEDESLQAELIQPAELAAFCAAVVAAGKRCGFAFAEDEVLAAYRQSRSAWLMREAL
jgi:hypothetical protein